MILDDIRYFRTWPEGKEAISLSSHNRRLARINSGTDEIWFDPTLDGYEWRVVAEALAHSVLSYQNLSNGYADQFDRSITTIASDFRS